MITSILRNYSAMAISMTLQQKTAIGLQIIPEHGVCLPANHQDGVTRILVFLACWRVCFCAVSVVVFMYSCDRFMIILDVFCNMIWLLISSCVSSLEILIFVCLLSYDEYRKWAAKDRRIKLCIYHVSYFSFQVLC